MPDSLETARLRRTSTSSAGEAGEKNTFVPNDPPPAREMTSFLFASTSPVCRILLEQLGFREGADFLIVPSGLLPGAGRWGAPRCTLEAARERAIKAAREMLHHAIKTTHSLGVHSPQTHSLGVHSLSLERMVVVGVETLVFSGKRPLDRPFLQAPQVAGQPDIERAGSEARQMLKDLRGKTISIVTGLVVAQADRLRNERSASVVTRVFVRKFSELDVERYIATREPFGKGVVSGLEGRGVVLLEKIEGSYSNALGLPLTEFYDILHDALFADRIRFHSGPTDTSRLKPHDNLVPELSAVSVTLTPPGAKIRERSCRGTWGTAAAFAIAARNAGFRHCALVGRKIDQELSQRGIRTLSKHELGFPDCAGAGVFYLSGHSLASPNHRATACQMLRTARQAGQITVLEAVRGISELVALDDICSLSRDAAGAPLIDVLVSEIPEVLLWLDLKGAPQEWESLSGFLRERAVPRLRRHFATTFLRTPGYSHELVATPADIWVHPLDCPLPRARPAYGARLTAEHLHEYLSPRILLASRSPQRFALLCQLVAASKIEVHAAEHPEDHAPHETPPQRVVRLALEKARAVLETKKFTDDIELLIAADTEIAVPNDRGGLDIAAHPHTRDEAVATLRQLSGREHLAITGIAVVGADPQAARALTKIVSESVTTRVKFRRLSESEISDYADSDECLGRAGAYAIQGKGAVLVERIAGSYSNVVGLPLERVAGILDREFGMPVWDLDAKSNWRRPRRLKETLTQGRVAAEMT